LSEDIWRVEHGLDGKPDSLSNHSLDGNGTLKPERALLHETIIQAITEREVFDHRYTNYHDQLFDFIKPLENSDAFKALISQGNFTRSDVSVLLDQAGLQRLPEITTANHTTVMIMGGPAVGKTNLLRDFRDRYLDLHDSAVRINPDDYKAIFADPDDFGREYADMAHRESSLLAKQAAARIAEKLDAGQAPNVVMDVVAATPERMLLAQKSGSLAVIGGAVPLDVALERAHQRYAETGRLVPSSVVLDGARKASLYTPDVFAHPNASFSLYNTDVPMGQSPVLAAELPFGTRTLSAYAPDDFLDYARNRHVNIEAGSLDQLYPPTVDTPDSIAQDLKRYTDKDLQIDLLNPDGQPALSLHKEGAEIHAPLDSRRGTRNMTELAETFGDNSKKSGPIAGTVVAMGAGGLALAGGASVAEAGEIVYEGAMPYGETQIDLARGDWKAAEHSAIVETASTIGSGVGGAAGIGLGVLAGAAYGSVVPGVGTAVGAVAGLTLSVTGGYGAGWLTEKFLSAAGEKKADAAPEHTEQAEYAVEADRLLTRDRLARLPIAEDMPPELAHLVETQTLLTRAENTGDENKIDTAQGWYDGARQATMDSDYLPDILHYAQTHSPNDTSAPAVAADWKPGRTAAPVTAFEFSAP